MYNFTQLHFTTPKKTGTASSTAPARVFLSPVLLLILCLQQFVLFLQLLSLQFLFTAMLLHSAAALLHPAAAFAAALFHSALWSAALQS